MGLFALPFRDQKKEGERDVRRKSTRKARSSFVTMQLFEVLQHVESDRVLRVRFRIYPDVQKHTTFKTIAARLHFLKLL